MNNIAVKKILSSLFSASGILSALEQYYLSGKAFILMYHRVLNPADSQRLYVQPGMFVTSNSFSKQIAFLKERFEVVFLEELVKKIVNGEDVGGLCAITFDDGWLDNYTEAFPVLKKYGVPATIFLATGFIGTDRIFWPEELCCYLEQGMAVKPESESVPQSYICFNDDINRYRQCQLNTFFDRSIEILKGYSSDDREEVLGFYRSILNTDSFPRQMINWIEAREMLSSGLVRFAAHTVNHEMLDQLSFQKAREEIVKSRADIEHNLGRRVTAFAYPNGNYTENVLNILAESGFTAAVTTRKGFLARDTPLMEIPRIAIHEDVSDTIPMFRSRILLRSF